MSETSPVRPPVQANPEVPREEDLERSLDRIITEGRPRLFRTATDLLATGSTAGIEVAFGILAMLYVDRLTHSVALGGLAFSVGFVALLLGHSELFTEGFLVPVTIVAAGEASIRRLVRLWIGTLVGNLAGGLLMALIIVTAFPSLHREAVSAAAHYVQTPIGAKSFCLALLGGGVITLLTRMQNGTDSDIAKILANVMAAFLLAGVRLFHSVLDSLLAYVALLGGRSTFGWISWVSWFAWVLLGNVLGGLALTTLLRLIRSRHRLYDHRIAAGHQPGAAVSSLGLVNTTPEPTGEPSPSQSAPSTAPEPVE